MKLCGVVGNVLFGLLLNQLWTILVVAPTPALGPTPSHLSLFSYFCGPLSLIYQLVVSIKKLVIKNYFYAYLRCAVSSGVSPMSENSAKTQNVA